MLEMRRSMVLQHASMGWTQTEIGKELGVSQKTVSSDLAILAKEARESLRSYREKLPLEYALVLSNLRQIRKEVWKIEEKSEIDKIKMEACDTIMQVNESIMYVLETAGNVDFEVRAAEVEMARAREEYNRLKEKVENKNLIEEEQQDDPQHYFKQDSKNNKKINGSNTT